MRFSLLSILLATAFAALVVASVIRPAEVWYQAAVTLTVLSLLTAAAVAYAARESWRVFCIGFLIGCGGYFSIAVVELLDVHVALITNVPGQWLEERLNREEGWRIEVIIDGKVQLFSPSYQELPADSNHEEILTYLTEKATVDFILYRENVVPGYPRMERELFVSQLHCWWSIMLGTALGVLAVTIRRRADARA